MLVVPVSQYWGSPNEGSMFLLFPPECCATEGQVGQGTFIPDEFFRTAGRKIMSRYFSKGDESSVL